MKKIIFPAFLLLLLAACQSVQMNESKNKQMYVDVDHLPPPPPISGEELRPNPSNEGYKSLPENPFMSVQNAPLSTFSIDVDRAAYSNVRRMINEGRKPPADAVRIEEMINYFEYDYPQPEGEVPFSINTEIGECKWNPKHKLMLVGLQGKKMDLGQIPAANLVFLLDVSGSMSDQNKLPLLVSSLKLLTENLREQDKVSIVVYAGAAGLVLPATSGNNKAKIAEALDRLQAGGSTAGGEGLILAYKVAKENFIKNGNNRIILATDGDFNVGELYNMAAKLSKENMFLSVFCFGRPNKETDEKLNKLSQKGNGNYQVINIDNIDDALLDEVKAVRK